MNKTNIKTKPLCFLIYKLARNYTTKSATDLIIDKKESNSANKNTSIMSLEYASQIISDKTMNQAIIH